LGYKEKRGKYTFLKMGGGRLLVAILYIKRLNYLSMSPGVFSMSWKAMWILA
jgi:hypothetical protein